MNLTILMIPLVAILGYAAGVGINYLSDVLPRWRSLVAPFCTHCEARVPARYYLGLTKVCPVCGQRRQNLLRAFLVEFGVIGVCDGIAMNHMGMKYSLASRELIADSVEVMATGHALDALVLIPRKGAPRSIGPASKAACSRRILDALAEMLHGR